jgi:hypothetical protein
MKKNRGLMVAFILGGSLGGLLSYMGFPPETWQFWLVTLIANGMMINARFNP